MKQLLSILFFLFISSFSIFAQYINLDDPSIQRVVASSLNMRETPSKSAKIVASIPKNTTLYTITNPLDEREVIDGKSGAWIQAYYQGKYGYVFSAYLVEEEDFDKGEKVLENIYFVTGSNEDERPLMDQPQIKGATQLDAIQGGSAVYMLDAATMKKAIRTGEDEWIKIRYKENVGYMRSDFLMNREDYALYLESIESGE